MFEDDKFYVNQEEPDDNLELEKMYKLSGPSNNEKLPNSKKGYLLNVLADIGLQNFEIQSVKPYKGLNLLIKVTI